MHGPPTHVQRPDHPRRSRSNEKRRTRPPPHWFTLGSFRTLAKRVAHPPPPVKEERYFMFVAPRYDVKLEDVIEGKRLPPLSLQDFEDYLTHVEGTSQNLHFYLWIKHYRHLHQLWASSVLPTFNIPSSSTGVYRSRDLWERLYPCQDRVLRDEFNYAKHNFFIKDAPMRLNICYELRRRVTMISNGPPMDGQEFTNKLPSFPNQPDPALFDPILAHITVQLREAFDRFLRIAFCNSGLWHACLGHLLGITILVPGLSLWCMGVGLAGNSGRRGRGFVAASLPLIWVGVWFMLVTVLGHCLGVWATGDARQLYPYETTRPLPPETSVPPVYSLARPPEPPPPAYSLSLLSARKLSAGSGISTSRVKAYLNAGKRGSDGVLSLRMFGRRKEGETDEEDGAMELNARASLDQRRRSEGALKTLVRDEKGEEVEVDARRTMERAAEMELKLPPARRTKDLSRQSFGIDALPAHPNLAPSSLAPRDTSTDVETGWKTTTDLGECVFTEADDFGIVVSEAYEEDEPYPLSPLPHAASSNHPNSTMEARSASTSPTETPHSVVPVSEHSTPRKSTIPEITLTPPPTASKLKPSHALEWVMSQATPVRPRKEGLVSPRWRNLLGPMTLVHDPLVRRAHWALTVRCWAVAGVVTCGMALGFIR